MRSEDVPFTGGPLDGRRLPVLVGMTGRPPKTYRVPVPGEDGTTASVLVYRLRATGTNRLGLPSGWHYAHDPSGRPAEGPRWPWSKPRAVAETPADDATDPPPGESPRAEPPRSG
ncbi:hypothetical protein [Streptomyces bohaiensis]|uniref:hypothetical protein n=1 Tax=Streptomyces bohaiensis TaxID=1431344 RepID=UPI0028A8E5DB|nr:hypothetical protein [Streptomyces bohaiensis]